MAEYYYYDDIVQEDIGEGLNQITINYLDYDECALTISNLSPLAQHYLSLGRLGVAIQMKNTASTINHGHGMHGWATSQAHPDKGYKQWHVIIPRHNPVGNPTYKQLTGSAPLGVEYFYNLRNGLDSWGVKYIQRRRAKHGYEPFSLYFKFTLVYITNSTLTYQDINENILYGYNDLSSYIRFIPSASDTFRVDFNLL